MAAIYKPRRSQRVVSRTVNAHGFVETLTQGGTTYTKSGLHRDTVGPGLSEIVSTQGGSWRLQDPSDDSEGEDEDVMPPMPPVSNTLSSTASLLWGSSPPPSSYFEPSAASLQRATPCRSFFEPSPVSVQRASSSSRRSRQR
ncbi:unnamed protein product [Tilletia controversa]|uniref:Uncharacterized protein n=1 Tax=Tilletia controversa TaxID=13291 RepID=A0A8X7MKZ4_9BASI|nr:hypothetical protein A4X06_0g7896 [Tilletia controversa]CAD6929244.1 unnamed protein product [Tilletia controversa]